MGLKRWVRRKTQMGILIDSTKTIIEEGSVIRAAKRMFKEELAEDSPLTVPIYRMGNSDGKIEGYAAASNEYEKKLLKQADEFLTQKENFKNQKVEYEKLLDEYEREIENLNNKQGRTEKENAYLRELLLRERGLRRLIG